MPSKTDGSTSLVCYNEPSGRMPTNDVKKRKANEFGNNFFVVSYSRTQCLLQCTAVSFAACFSRWLVFIDYGNTCTVLKYKNQREFKVGGTKRRSCGERVFPSQPGKGSVSVANFCFVIPKWHILV